MIAREAEGENAAAARSALAADIAAVVARDSCRKGETESGAGDAAGKGIVSAVEALEDLLLLARGDPGAPIENRDANIAILDARAKFDFLFRNGVFFGVREKIDYDLDDGI